MPVAGGGRKRGTGGAASAATASPGPKRTKVDPDSSRASDQSQQQAHIHTAQGHQLPPPPPQQYHHAAAQHYNASHAASANIYADHSQAVAPGATMGTMEATPPNNFTNYHAQTPVQQPRYQSQPYTAAPVAPSTNMPTPTLNGAIHSPYTSTAIPTQTTPTTQPKQSQGSTSQDLPPNPRIRLDGKGRDPYNIETICKQLGISAAVWDQKLRTELTKVIDHHGLAGQKVIPTNLAAREAAVDEWIRNCVEWMNEPNDRYRKVYAMDRLKCGMADIRRTQNQRSKRNQRPGDANATNGTGDDNEDTYVDPKEEPGTTSPEQIPTQRAPSGVPAETPTPMPATVPPTANLPIFPSEQRTITGTGSITATRSTPPGQSIEPPPPPHSATQSAAPPTPYSMIYPNNGPITPGNIMLTIVENYSGQKCTAIPNDFMQDGHYSWQKLTEVLREDVGFNPHLHRLFYEGPYGRVYVSSDRTLCNGIALEVTRGQGFPKWEIAMEQ
ncbi:hypothetical protein DRE_03487 [Drechslerella stenobrocha 248]|uniref:Uncharacterized protein n=1 Tax=Drechslerella stenobrocha 248 TaxID=1043628 RepID=W7I4N5_9PEZI|nr:hypothetical protein DRE_03487 [Drechslerella stenobrocha 248]